MMVSNVSADVLQKELRGLGGNRGDTKLHLTDGVSCIKAGECGAWRRLYVRCTQPVEIPFPCAQYKASTSTQSYVLFELTHESSTAPSRASSSS
jgi:hypothetical protein